MTKIIETETFTVNADDTLHVTRVIEFTESTEEPYLINTSQTLEDFFMDRDAYKNQKENLVYEGTLEMERGTEKVAAAEEILKQLGVTEIKTA